jgi:signal transduction histidine kinase
MSTSGVLDEMANQQSMSHDIREMNKSLKGAAEQIREIFKHHRNILGRDEYLAHKVFFASEMITKRLDVYDFYRYRSSIDVRERRYRLHRMIIKLMRILQDKANAKSVTLNVNESYIEVTSSTKFEVAVFVIFENFIKYSPDNMSVDIEIVDNEGRVDLIFSGYGPLTTEEERKRVFEFGFRAARAKKLTDEGSGIGLHFARDVCELHGFQILFEQISSDSYSLKKHDYHRTTVRIGIPKDV